MMISWRSNNYLGTTQSFRGILGRRTEGLPTLGHPTTQTATVDLIIAKCLISITELALPLFITKPMSPLIACSTFAHPCRKSVAHWPSPFRTLTLMGERPIRNHRCKSLAVGRVVSVAKFGTTSAERAELNYNDMSMPLEKRIEARRREQLDIDARGLEKNFTRSWKVGDVYAPHDLSAAEARKWRKRKGPSTDAFDALSMNPLDYYKVSSMIKYPQVC